MTQPKQFLEMRLRHLVSWLYSLKTSIILRIEVQSSQGLQIYEDLDAVSLIPAPAMLLHLLGYRLISFCVSKTPGSLLPRDLCTCLCPAWAVLHFCLGSLFLQAHEISNLVCLVHVCTVRGVVVLSLAVNFVKWMIKQNLRD